MGYFSKGQLTELEFLAVKLRTGKLSRRSFLAQATALGATAAMASALAAAWTPEALGQSTGKSPKPQGTYDYIVIGSGSAGAALAWQLTLKSGGTVLVLEAGRDDNLKEVHDSRLWPASLGTDATKWFETTPQNYVDGRTHKWPRGNVLGGTSALNAMIFARGHRSDYDNWAYQGCAGWSFADVLPHFVALENYEPGGEHRGKDGPVYVTQPADGLKHEGAIAFMDACATLGYRETKSINSERMEGQAWVDFNIKDQQRQSSATAFLRKVMGEKTLDVLVDAPVQKLNFEGTRCAGVTYLHGGEPVTVKAAREVVLSAGAIDSPRLLMLSGIGPAADLKTLGIDPIVDLPVGIGLQDHILGAGPNWEASRPVPVSNYNHSEVYMWERSDSRLPAPDTTVLYVSVPFAASGHKLDYKDGYCILSGVNRPVSKGYIKLRSSNPNDPLIIEANYLREEQDWKAYSWSTKLAREIGNSAAYAPYRKREALVPGKAMNEKEWRTYLAASVNTFFHPTSTCRMGVGADSVVNPELKVHGIENLRVADASIMPEITTSNTNCPSMMIGWKCGDMMTNKA